MKSTPATYFSDVERCVDAILDKVGKRIVFGMPLGLGKPNHLANALYERAKRDASISLRIMTALSLAVPKGNRELERRFLQPFTPRGWGNNHALRFPDALTADAVDSTRCSLFHFVDVAEHVEQRTGARKGALSTLCTDCHFYKVARNGAGRRGAVFVTPTGSPSDQEFTYWVGDTSSHLTGVPRKTNIGVDRVTPGSAMPVPYTSKCGRCHDVTSLKY